ncbi:MFS transporter [Caloranaerobacter sp. DY30410]|uniref:MFS transporter n=1 Tax=Caloranaerobacter sp. DY30410 TaxID=3238305 RepID=UPI003CFFDFF9
MGITRNIKTYYIYSIFADLLILGPIIVLFLTAKGLSFTEIMLLQSVAAISVVIFEVPTGAFADKFGRKVSMLIGAILWATSLLIYILGTKFLTFMLAEITFSLGATLKSGADTALIYDSLKSIGREREFQSIEGYARSLALYAQAVGSIIAGFVYKVNIFLPLYISIGFMFITAIVILNFIEPPIEGKKGKYGSNYLKQIKESGIYIARHEKIKAIMLFSMIFFIFYRAGFWYFQPYMESVKIPVEYFGIIFFIFNIVAAITSKRCHLIMEKTKPRTLSFMAFLIILSFALLGVIRVWVGVLAILLQQMARGLYRPVTTKYLNKHIPSDKRATILSFQSLITNIAVAVTLPFMGVLKDSTDIFTTHLILAGIMLVLVLAVMRYMNKRLGVKQAEKSGV